MTKARFNCRDTAGYVTDGANSTYLLYANTYVGSPGSVNGVSAGWIDPFTQRGNADLSLSNPVSLAGCVYQASASVFVTIRVDFPAGSTSRTVRLAIGASNNGFNPVVGIYDDASLLTTITGATTTNTFRDANNADHTAANWEANNTAYSLTMSTDILNIRMGPQVTDATCIACVEVEFTPSGGGGGKPHHYFAQMRNQ